MDLLAKYQGLLHQAITEVGLEVAPEACVWLPSDRPDLGQWQYNGAMALAGQAHQPPRQIAEQIAGKLRNCPDFTEVSVAGPGFINVSLQPAVLAAYLEQLRQHPEGIIAKTHTEKVILDYGGPNIAKVLHVGHLRSANIGEALKRLARALGCQVTADVHLGDWGRPMGLVMLELKSRYPDWPFFNPDYQGEYPAELPITAHDLEEIYPVASQKAKEDAHYLEEARDITAQLQAHQRGYYELWRRIVAISVADIKRLYGKLGVDFDLWLGESDADAAVPEVIDDLKQRDLAYRSDGALVVDTEVEDDTRQIPPLMLEKSNGAITYETTDLATIYQRMRDAAPDQIWYVVDKRQELHFMQVFRVARRAEYVPTEVELDFIGFGTMNGTDGKPFKTRDGGVMTLSGLIELVETEVERQLNPKITGAERQQTVSQVAAATLKYADLLPNRATDYIFDVQKFTDLNGKTGVYILYSIIRMRSLLSKAGIESGFCNPLSSVSAGTAGTVADFADPLSSCLEPGGQQGAGTPHPQPAGPLVSTAPAALKSSSGLQNPPITQSAPIATEDSGLAESAPITMLPGDTEVKIALKIAELPSVLEKAYAGKTMSDVAEYLYQLVELYNTFYGEHKVLTEVDAAKRASWLGLTRLTEQICTQLAEILGLTVPEKI